MESLKLSYFLSYSADFTWFSILLTRKKVKIATKKSGNNENLAKRSERILAFLQRKLFRSTGIMSAVLTCIFLLASIWRRLLNIGQVETLKALLVDDDQGFDLQEFLLSVQAFIANKPSGDGIFKFLWESLKAPAGIVPARFSSRLHVHIP